MVNVEFFWDHSGTLSIDTLIPIVIGIEHCYLVTSVSNFFRRLLRRTLLRSVHYSAAKLDKDFEHPALFCELCIQNWDAKCTKQAENAKDFRVFSADQTFSVYLRTRRSLNTSIGEIRKRTQPLISFNF